MYIANAMRYFLIQCIDVEVSCAQLLLMALHRLTAFNTAASVSAFHKGLRFARTIYRASRSRIRV